MTQLEKGKLKVVLLENVPNLGNVGDNKYVAAGFARNYLFPRNLATLATPSALKEAEERKHREYKRQQITRAAQEEVFKKMNGYSLKISAKAGAEGRLFGSVTPALIAEKLKESSGYSIDKRKIVLPEPLRKLGTYEIKIQISPDLMPSLTLEIEEKKAG